MSNAAVATPATDRKAIMRDKRAQGIAAMGLVTREGDRFRVATPSLRGRTANYEVWRDETGRVCCSCLEFEEHVADDTTFRCEHILAVKHSLLAKKFRSGNQAAVGEGGHYCSRRNPVCAQHKRKRIREA
jgi:hypothetical protein